MLPSAKGLGFMKADRRAGAVDDTPKKKSRGRPKGSASA